MLHKHVLKFGVNDGEDDRENSVGMKIFECLDIPYIHGHVHVCVCVCLLERESRISMYEYRMMEPQIHLVLLPH